MKQPKFYKGRLRHDIRKNFFPARVVEPWHRLFRAGVESPSPEVWHFKIRFSSMVRFSWRLDSNLKGLFQP